MKMKTSWKYCSGAIYSVIIILLFATSAAAAWKNVGRVTSVAKSKTNGVVLDTSSGAQVLVEYSGVDVVHVRMAPTGRFERDFSYAIDGTDRFTTPLITVSQNASTITLTKLDGMRVVIGRAPFSVSMIDGHGQTVMQTDKFHPAGFDRATGEIQTSMLRRSEVETYYGFGEKAFAEMSRDGKFIVNWNTDTFSYPIGTDPIYQTIPFFTALYEGRAYGLFFNNTFRSWFDMGARSPERYSFGASGGELDYYVFTGGVDRSPKRVLSDYALLTGTTPLPPIWALGINSRDGRIFRNRGSARSPTVFAKIAYPPTLSISTSITWTAIEFSHGTKRVFPIRPSSSPISKKMDFRRF